MQSAQTGSWFRSQAGRRFGRDFALLILAKIVLLTILYFVFVAHQPRADTSAAAMQQHVLDTTPATGSAHDR